MSLSATQLKKLQIISEATAGEHGSIFMTEKNVKILIDGGYAECNTQIREGEAVAVRSTPLGEALLASPDQTETGRTTMDKPNFSIDDNIAVPAIRRASGGKPSIYPFDQLELGQSFFVPETEELPNPGKSLASTVSGASKRFATKNGTRTIRRRPKLTNEDGSPMLDENGKQIKGELTDVEVPAFIYERKFIVRSVEENGVAGARVWRVEAPNEAE